jgi:hypothetical protein
MNTNKCVGFWYKQKVTLKKKKTGDLNFDAETETYTFGNKNIKTMTSLASCNNLIYFDIPCWGNPSKVHLGSFLQDLSSLMFAILHEPFKIYWD